MDYQRLFTVADRARARAPLPAQDLAFVRDDAPAALSEFPKIGLPKSVAHPAGFTVSGAPVGTFVRSALLLAGRKALGDRYGDPFYERVETDLAMRIMRSNFHGGAPKGAYCCKQCTLGILPVLEAGAIRWFDGPALAAEVRRLVAERGWRFSTPANGAMQRWALAAP